MTLLLGPPSGRRHPAAGGGVSGVFEEVRPGRAATALTSAETASRRRPLLGTANATAPARETQSNAPGLGVPGPSRGSAPPRRHTRAPHCARRVETPTLLKTEARRRQR